MLTTVFDPTYPNGYTEKYPLILEDIGYYSPDQSYNINDVVRHLGSVFKSRINRNKKAPATWKKRN